MPDARFQSDDRSRVRDASDIVDIVGEVVALKPKGREFVGLCPFHDDHNPSMAVVPGKQIFHCFACGSGGDVFTFVQKFHRLDFREALAFLARRANIELAPRRPADRHRDAARLGLADANAAALDFFRSVLRHPEHGEPARAVIKHRGISPEMLERFALGAAPDRWDGLLLALQKKSLDPAAFLEAGLLKKRESSDGCYDALRHRLVFPIHDLSGRVIAFGGRKIRDEDEPKYLNSPETALFHKSDALYGLHQAGRAIQKTRTAIVVEGYTDVIACHQAGVENAVATLGTALTPGHARILRRLADRVVLVFDGDDAGQRAADRAIEVLLTESIDIRIAPLSAHTDAKDPDELLKRDGGRALFDAAIAQAADLLTFRYARLRGRLAGASVAQRDRTLTDELARLSELGFAALPPLRQRLIIHAIAEAAGVDEPTIRGALPAGRRARALSPADGPTSPDSPPTPRELALGCLLCEGSLWRSIDGPRRELLRTEEFTSPLSRAVADAVLRLAYDGQHPALAEVLAELDADAMDRDDDDDAGATLDAKAHATRLQRLVDQKTAGDPARLLAELRGCLDRAAVDLRLANARSQTDPLARLVELKRVHESFGANPRARLSRE